MTRWPTTTQKIERAATGLNGALYVHVEHDLAGKIHSVRYSYRWKDDQGLDRILRALGDATTIMLRDIQQGALKAEGRT